MTRRTVGTVLLTMAPLVGGCHRPAESSAEVAGVYVMRRQAADTLRLTADGRYMRIYRMPGEPAAVDSGRWFLADHGKIVALRDFPQRWHGIHDWQDPKFSPLARSMMGLAVERTWRGRIQLGWQSQFGFTYVRIPESR